MSWKCSESWDDPTNTWWQEQNAIDGILGTTAGCGLNPESYSEPIHFSPYADERYVLCDKVRFYSENSFEGECVVLVYTGSWVVVYEGGYEREEWVERSIPGGPVRMNKIKIAFGNDSEEEVDVYLNEIQYNHLASRSLVDDSLAVSVLIAGGLVR